MRISFFKLRGFLDFSPHPYDIGNPIGLWHKYADNHFLLKMYKLREQHFAEYYNYHLTFAVTNAIVDDEGFFRYIWNLVENRIKYYSIQSPFSSSHDLNKNNIHRLQIFQCYLKSIDQWNARPSDLIIAEKDEIIQKQKNELVRWQERLEKLEAYEVTQKIRIEEKHLPVLADLIQQMRELELPSGRKLLKADHKSPFYMMICKYFSDGGDDIPIQTARNYFKGNGDYIKSKSRPDNCKENFFLIAPLKSVKK